MNRLFASGPVHAMQSGKGPFLFLLHSLLSGRASFDAVVPRLSQSFRVVVPELPGFGGSQAVSGGLAAVADRMAEALTDAAGGDDVFVLGNRYGGFVGAQMAIRHPPIPPKLILPHFGASCFEGGRPTLCPMCAAAPATGLSALPRPSRRP